MSAALATGLLFGLMILLLPTGVPIAFILGSIAVIFTFFIWGPQGLTFIATTAWSNSNDFVMLCIPLFIFMGVMMERSGIGDDLFASIYKWSGSLGGGLAAGTVLICMAFAAMTGLSGPAAVTVGLIALPAMFKRKYDKTIALGSVNGGSALGILIPPSIIMVLYALVTTQSVGKLFMAGLIPGILLGCMMIAYILIRCALQPRLGPPLPPEERSDWKGKLVSLKGLVLPLIIIFAVLGTIFTGVATPTEAAAFGALATVISAAINRQLNWQIIKETSTKTLSVTCMVMIIYLGAMCFSRIYYVAGARDMIEELLLGVGGRWPVMITMQLIWLVMGAFLDPFAIILITVPTFSAVAVGLDFNPIWFGILYVINTEMAYLTPPYGFNLFYLKGVAPPGVTMGDLYRSVWPFVLIQAACLGIIMLFPQIALWLPNLMLK